MAKTKKTRTRQATSRLTAQADAVFDRHASEITVRLGWFFLRHLHETYRSFRGDFLLAFVLGEIAHHNICHYFSAGKSKPAGRDLGWQSEEGWATLQPCNAFSLSTATGIPRETCRRKVQALVRKGWVERHPKGGYVMARHLGQHFHENNRRTFRDTMNLLADLESITKEAPSP